MAKRTKANKVADGHKATAVKIAQWGPDEPARAGRQAIYTKEHPREDRSANPHIREKIYPPEDFERVRKFKIWAREHPNTDLSENPHRWRPS